MSGFNEPDPFGVRAAAEARERCPFEIGEVVKIPKRQAAVPFGNTDVAEVTDLRLAVGEAEEMAFGRGASLAVVRLGFVGVYSFHHSRDPADSWILPVRHLKHRRFL